jgi:hypothetical protein
MTESEPIVVTSFHVVPFVSTLQRLMLGSFDGFNGIGVIATERFSRLHPFAVS